MSSTASLMRGTLRRFGGLILFYIFLSPGASAQVTVSGNVTFTGNNTHSGTETFANIDAIQFVDGVTNTTVQQAVNRLPTGGGIVYIPQGTYAGPTTIPTGVRLIGLGTTISSAQLTALGGVLAYGLQNQIVLQYPSGFSLSGVAGIGMENLVLDMQNNGTNVTFKSVTNGLFDLAIINCGTTNPCFTGTTNNAANSNMTLNVFRRLWLQGGTVSLDLTTPTAGTSFTTENWFGDVLLAFPSTTGILFDKWCDSNFFERVSLFSFGNVNGLVFNGSTTTDQGIYFIHINKFDDTASGITTASAMIVNPSKGNYVGTGLLAGFPGANLFKTNNPATLPTSFTWNDFAGNKLTNTNTLTLPALYLDTPSPSGVPGWSLQVAEVLKWHFYDGGSDIYFTDDASGNHHIGVPQGANGGVNVYGPITAVGTAAGLSGTGACATITTQKGGAAAGQLTCTGTTGASTVVVTPGITAPNGFSCWANDLTTGANVLRQSAVATTTCTIAGTVNANDVLTFGLVAY